ncbi:S8 family serine peptidase [Actinoplanes sp. NPDC051851]|uniref:S8 family serine peptidase n=1 Tax=Actinoplanes sp. NPDC051851 TaxID=3154753 RepID=UPI003426832B
MGTKKQVLQAAALATATAAAVTLANPFGGPAAVAGAAGGIAVDATINGLNAPSATRQVELSADAQAELAGHGISADRATPAATILGTDPYRNLQYGFDAIQAPYANTASTGTDVVVGVIDSGVARVDDLAGGRVLTGKDFVASGDGSNDQNGHGTGVASILAATTGNGVGIAGVAPSVRILPVRVCNAAGSCPVDAIAAGITWAVDHGAQVLNISVGGASTDALTAAVAYAESKGVPIAASVGNSAESDNVVLYPGGYDTVLGVGAVDENKVRASFSEYGTQVDVVAPGMKILEADLNNKFIYSSGTSQAAPYVAGTMALAKAYQPSITAATLRTTVTGTATDLGSSGRDDEYGAGLVNAAAVLTKLGATLTDPTVTPSPGTTTAPVVGGVLPLSGTTEGGTTVTVNGSGFSSLDPADPSAVTFGGVDAASFTVLSNSRLTAVTPPGVNGAATIVTTNTIGGSTGKVAFTYRAPLGAEFDAGITAKVAGGTVVPVTVTGGTVGNNVKEFAAEKITATVGDNAATVIWTDPTHVKVTAPVTQKAAATTITLIHDGVAGPASTATVGYAPVTNFVTPAKVSSAGGTTVMLTGSGYLGVDGDDPSAVTFGGVPATSFRVKSATQIVAVTPPGVNGTLPVVVTTSGGTASLPIKYRTPIDVTVTASSVVKATGGTVTLEVTPGTIGASAKEFTAELVTATVGTAKAAPVWVDATHVKVPFFGSTGDSATLTLYHDGIAGTPAAIAYVPVVVGLSANTDTVAGGRKINVKVAGGDVAKAVDFAFGGVPASCTATGRDVSTIYSCVVPAAAEAGSTWVSFTSSTGVASRYSTAATFAYTDID